MTAARDLSSDVGAYVAFYETLTPDSIERLEALCAPGVRFRDPFNEVTGIPAYRAILQHMFKQVSSPRFQVVDWAQTGSKAYLRWTFTFSQRKGAAPWVIEGMSEVHFDEQGRVCAHLDHWDSGNQFYARLPLLGRLIELIRKRLSVAVL
ncbi:MAG: nuclear transport factor 2 family protein [Pseudomonadota bacterium]